MALTWLGKAVGFLLVAMVAGLVELFSEPPQRGGRRGQYGGGQYRGGRSRGGQYRGGYNRRSRRRYDYW